jgi:hypothetical protein
MASSLIPALWAILRKSGGGDVRLRIESISAEVATQASDGDEPPDRGLGQQAARCFEGVETVARWPVRCGWVSVHRIHLQLATTAVAAVLFYGLSGHSVPQVSSHDDMAGAAAGLCLLLVTVLGYVATPKPQAHERVVVADAAPGYVEPSPRPPLSGRARASPSTLWRFRN